MTISPAQASPLCAPDAPPADQQPQRTRVVHCQPSSGRCQPVVSVGAANEIRAEAAGAANARGDTNATVAAVAADAEEQAAVAALAAVTPKIQTGRAVAVTAVAADAEEEAAEPAQTACTAAAAGQGGPAIYRKSVGEGKSVSGDV